MSFFKGSKKYLVVLSILFLFVIIDNKYYYQLNSINLKHIKHYYIDDYISESKRIEKKYGINIIYDVSSDPGFVLEQFAKPPYNCKFSQISDFELSRYIYLLPSILDLYPESVIRKNLKGIVLLGSLSFYDLNYGGTYLDSNLYLTSNRYDSDYYLKSLFHHEISSMFLYRYKFEVEKWKTVNPPNFDYLKTKEEILSSVQKDADNEYSDPALLKDGFLKNYAKSDFENDFNTYAEVIFTYPERMRQLINQYPKIKQKYLIIKSFYININPLFSSVFDKIL